MKSNDSKTFNPFSLLCLSDKCNRKSFFREVFSYVIQFHRNGDGPDLVLGIHLFWNASSPRLRASTTGTSLPRETPTQPGGRGKRPGT